MIRELVEPLSAESDRDIQIPIGVMIETPRAAVTAADLAGSADFLSFGTNDLTQLTFGLSRDDAGPVLEPTSASGCWPADPFATIDVDGVGELVRLGVDRAGPSIRPSRSACAASTAAIRRRSRSSGRSGSTTSRARRSGCRSPAWPRPAPCWARPAGPRPVTGVGRAGRSVTPRW